MILAGVDEAGYGPLLGPLVVGCCAFELPDCEPGDLPCLWKLLRKAISKKRSADGRRLHFNDSKLVYNPGLGLKELERSVLALAAQRAGPCEQLQHFIQQTAFHCLDDLEAHAWYARPAGEKFPFEQDAIAVKIAASSLGSQMLKANIQCVHYAARLVCEKQLNRMLAATRNKASVLFSTSAIHLDHLLRQYGEKNLTIFCDQQGGRAHYASLLRLMFGEWSLEIITEGDGYAEYHLTRNGHLARIIFCEKAETQCLSVAAASMLCKYLREALMSRFNAFWFSHLPEVQPTAGYYNDGARFLRDIEVKRRELGIRDEGLVRAK